MFTRQFRFLNKSGFTLIEMLVVMTIIGVLAGLTLTGFEASRKASRDGRRRSDLEQIRSGLEMCRADTGSYPLGDGTDLGTILSSCATYLPPTLTDPRNPTYKYRYLGPDNLVYYLCARLETGTGDVGCGTCGVVGNCNYVVRNP